MVGGQPQEKRCPRALGGRRCFLWLMNMVPIFRYFVMREMTVGLDAEFSLDRFDSRYRADLAMTWAIY